MQITSLINYFNPGLSNKPLLGLRIKGIKYKVFIRRNSNTDKIVLKYVFHKKYGQFHLPPSTLKLPEDCTIVDLGSNIGLTVAHYKNKFPSSKVIGYEMDKDNFNLAKINCKNYKNVFLNNEAVWIHAGTITYLKEKPDDSFCINTGGNTKNKKKKKAKTITIGGIINAV